MRHVKVNGVEVAYEVVGRGEPILFIHGAHLADAMRPLVEIRPSTGSSASVTTAAASAEAAARPRPGQRRSPCMPRMPSGSSSTWESIVLMWWATQAADPSPSR